MHSLWETMLVRWLEPEGGEPVRQTAAFAELAAGISPAAALAIAVRREPSAAAPTTPSAAGGAASRRTAVIRTPAGRAVG